MVSWLAITSYIILHQLICILTACPPSTPSNYFNCDVAIRGCYGCTMTCTGSCLFDVDSGTAGTYTDVCSNALILGNDAASLESGTHCTGCVNTTIHAETITGSVDWRCSGSGSCYGLELYCGDINTYCLLECNTGCNSDTKIYIPSSMTPTPTPSLCSGSTCSSVQIIVITENPTNTPSNIPSSTPTNTPTQSTTHPTTYPTDSPTLNPSESPTNIPSNIPTETPTNPSESPTLITFNPTYYNEQVIETTLSETRSTIKTGNKMHKNDSIDINVIIGILIGIFALIIIIIIVLLIGHKKRKNGQNNTKSIAMTNKNINNMDPELDKVSSISSNQLMLNDKDKNDNDIINDINNKMSTKGNENGDDNITEGQLNDIQSNDEFEIVGDTQY